MIGGDGALVLVTLTPIADTGGGPVMPVAVGGYIGRSKPIEVPEGVSWRDALAEALATVSALEDALASVGYDTAYPRSVEEVAEAGASSLLVNGEPWDLP